MSIQSEIERISTNISTAYDAVNEKGGALPEKKNSANLATAIRGIISGGGGSQNMLINWYLADPINQQGENDYLISSASERYTIDGFASISTSETSYVSVVPDGLKISKGGVLYQKCDEEFLNFILGKTVTLSILTSDGTLYSGSGVVDYDKLVANVYIPNVGSMALYLFKEAKSYQIFRLYADEGEITLVAAKLELGSVQTLAHQAGDGSWALNDPPPDKALELAKCQRYQLVLRTGAYGRIGLGMADYTPHIATAFIPLPVGLRIRPSFSYSGSFSLYDGSAQNKFAKITDISFSELSTNGITIGINTGSDNITIGRPYQLIDSGNGDATIILDANL